MLINMQKTFAELSWVIPLCLIFLFFACQGPSVVEEEAETSFDGETIYKGLLQGRGPVADLVPEVRDYLKLESLAIEKHELDEIRKVQDRIVETIHQTQPGFFIGFEEVMQSGDHLAIQEKLREAGKVTFDAISSWPESRLIEDLAADPESFEAALSKINLNLPENERLSSEDIQELLTLVGNRALVDASSTSDELWVWVVAALAVVVAAAIAVATVAVVNWTVNYNIPEPDKVQESYGRLSQLTKERMINSVAEKLAVAQ